MLGGLLGGAGLATADTNTSPASTKALDEIVVTAPSDDSTFILSQPSQTGSRLGIPVKDLPASVEVISQEVMRQRGNRTATEAVEGAVGMTGGNAWGSIPLFSSRGFADTSVTVLYDGVRQNNAAQHSRPLDTWILDRIEVLKGPASVLQGEGAVGGVVNYVTKVPTQERMPTELLFEAGSFGSSRLGFGLDGPASKNASFRLSGVRAASDGYVQRSGHENYQLAGALRWQSTPAFSAVLHMDGSRIDEKNYHGTPLINGVIDSSIRKNNYNIADAKSDSNDFRTRLDLGYAVTPDLTLRNQTYRYAHKLHWRNAEDYLYNASTRLIDYVGGDGAVYEFERDDILLGNRLEAQQRSSLFGRENRLVVGFEISRNTLDRRVSGSNASLPSVDPYNPQTLYGDPADYSKAGGGLHREINIDQKAVFFEDALDVAAGLKLLAGLRHDDIRLKRKDMYYNANDFERTYRANSGRLGAVYEAVPGITLYGQYSNAQSPPRSSLVSISASSKQYDLERARQYETGVKAQFAKTEMTFAYFDIQKRDVLTQVVTSGVRTTQQVGRQSANGIELTGNYRLDGGWRIDGNLALTRSRFDDFSESCGAGCAVSRAGNRPINVPDKTANLWLGRKWGGSWHAGGGLRYVGSRAYDNANTLFMPAYTVFDAAIGYRQKNYDIVLRGRNLTDKIYTAWTQVDGDGRQFRLADPRSFEISLRTSF